MSHTIRIESVAPAMWQRYYPFDPLESIAWLDAAWVPDRDGRLEVPHVAFPDDDRVEFSGSVDGIPEDFIEAVKADIVGPPGASSTR